MWYYAPLLFLSGVMTDVVYALYVMSLAERKRLPAANYSTMSGVLSIILVEGTLHVPYLLPFWLMGLWVGTYYAAAIESYVKGVINAHRKI